MNYSAFSLRYQNLTLVSLWLAFSCSDKMEVANIALLTLPRQMTYKHVNFTMWFNKNTFGMVGLQEPKHLGDKSKRFLMLFPNTTL